ncbi:unnamed protein product, partial [Prorocentrum cordatum]
MREQASGIAEVVGVAAPGAEMGLAGSSWWVADPPSEAFDQVIAAVELVDSTEDRDDGTKVQRALPLARAMEFITPKSFSDWLHPGPKATLEFLESVLLNGGDLLVWLNAFMRKSGVSENSSFSHELRNFVQIVRLAVSYDQVGRTNMAYIEQAVRVIHETQQAIRRNPKHSDFTGLDVGTIGSCDETGGARLHDFSSWLSAKQKGVADAMGAQRKWREEQAAKRRRTSDRGPPSHPKAKAKSKASPAAPQEGQGWGTVSSCGPMPTGMTAREAIWGSLTANDLQYVGEKNLAPYRPDLLKVAKGNAVPKPAVDLLPPEEAAFSIDPERYLVRSQPEDELTELNQGCGPIVEVPDLSVRVGDVEDAFYQFSVESTAELFGLDDPVRCSEFGLTEVGDNDLGRLRPVRSSEKVFPVFHGLPRGRSWALHFCATSVKYFTSVAVRVLLGHCVRCLVHLRPAMSALAHPYRFASDSLGRASEIPGKVKREFRWKGRWRFAEAEGFIAGCLE